MTPTAGPWLPVAVLFALAPAVGQPPPAARADSRHSRPDLQGIWRLATLTPLERPPEFAGKASLGEEEAAKWVRERSSRTADQRPADATADLNTGFNEFWFERGTELARIDGRYLTSRIVEPADGRIPPLTPGAQARVSARTAARRNDLAGGPETRSNTERCLSPQPIIGPNTEGNYLQIVQTRDYIVLHSEAMREVRIVAMNGRARRPPSLQTSLGES